ncbi:MAG: diaminopimelate decarboxylase [Phototrophicaceae bacterium]
MINESIRYHEDQLCVSGTVVQPLLHEHATPLYLYSAERIAHNVNALQTAFAPLHASFHFSVKANSNLAILRQLVSMGMGLDVVSGGELLAALKSGASSEQIVFAGVGKTPTELELAVTHRVGWVNIENVAECHLLNELARKHGTTMRVALRYNPEVQANTHPNIATGHKYAKFGLNRDALFSILTQPETFPHLQIEGLHVHVGSQLEDTQGTQDGIRKALEIVEAFPQIRTLNLGGGFPTAYDDRPYPTYHDFAQSIAPWLRPHNLHLMLEPGRSIVADSGILVTQVLYLKEQGGINLLVVDASMTELMRPALYGAHHQVVPLLAAPQQPQIRYTIVGPVCESTDVLAKEVMLPEIQVGDYLAILDVGAYGMVMSNNYNLRPRPAEWVIEADGSVRVVRQRQSYESLLADL